MQFTEAYKQTNLTLKKAIDQVSHLENVQWNLKNKNRLFFENESIKVWNYFISSPDSSIKHKNQSLALQFIADNI